VRERAALLHVGAFSDKWLELRDVAGKEAVALQVEWGKQYRPKALDHELASVNSTRTLNS